MSVDFLLSFALLWLMVDLGVLLAFSGIQHRRGGGPGSAGGLPSPIARPASPWLAAAQMTIR